MTLYEYARVLSLDVVLGSVAGASLAAYICGNLDRMPWSWWALLPLIVWFIYTVDHLLDARRIGSNAISPRHQFHYRHFRVLAALVLLAASFSGALILLFLPQPLVRAGLWLGAAAILHLILAQWTTFRYYPAEAIIAGLYTAGIWFGPWITPPGDMATVTRPAPEMSLALFFFAAFANLLVFSLFEREADARESPNTIVIFLGVQKSESVLYAISIATLIISGLLFRYFRDEVSPWIVLLLFSTANLPLLVYGLRFYFARAERYRIICDGVFLAYSLPALLTFFD